MQKTLDQERAQAAWAATESEQVSSDYASLCKGAPVMILTNGLGPTLAFFMAKAPGKPEYKRLGDAVAKWVLQDSNAQMKTLMNGIINGNADLYSRYTRETLAYMQWLKRFAEAKNS